MSKRAAAWVAALALGSAAPSDAAPVWIRAVEGQPVPGTAGTLSWHDQPQLNAAGDIAFRARIDEPESDPSSIPVVLVADGGGLRLVARAFEQAPGTPPGTEFLSFDMVSIDDAGRVAFKAALGSETYHESIWRADAAGNLELLAREGDPAPGLSGQPYTAFHSVIAGAAGHVVFHAVGGSGIWGAEPGEPVEPLVVPGDAAPGGGTFVHVGFTSRVNAAGDFAFYGTTTLGVSGVWSFRGGAPAERCLQLGSAPGIPGAQIFGVYGLDVNEAGDVGIGVQVMPSPLGPFPAAAGYVFESGAGLRLVATAGMEIAGHGGAQFEVAGFQPHLADDGSASLLGVARIGFGGVTDANEVAIWRIPASGDVELLGREGDPTPDPSLTYHQWFFSPASNGAGDVAFNAQMGSEEGAPERALVGAIGGGAPEILVAEGDVATLGVEEPMEVTFVRGPFQATERRDSVMNERGQVAVQVDVWDPIALQIQMAVAVVPEPGQGLLLATGAAALGLARRRRR